ncbi:hypothetical protein H6P81_016125 [Aristolochia fimbriata]|uniref:Alpha/beta hydrolase fold-3 domain-containing protein n=1 Tax=Aristolochia fimbriata TaxID=158543 RepID=A0AAV7E7C6_ARIFI|nr:hypothetical protein H6P81_016125 [Aristolochia fimbriata]
MYDHNPIPVSPMLEEASSSPRLNAVAEETNVERRAGGTYDRRLHLHLFPLSACATPRARGNSFQGGDFAGVFLAGNSAGAAISHHIACHLGEQGSATATARPAGAILVHSGRRLRRGLSRRE